MVGRAAVDGRPKPGNEMRMKRYRYLPESHARHTSHVTRHTSHITRHTSHVTRHTSHVTRHSPEQNDHKVWQSDEQGEENDSFKPFNEPDMQSTSRVIVKS